MNMNNDFLDLSIEDFTFAMLGRDTSHFVNDVDGRFNIKNFGYKDVARYLKSVSDNWDKELLHAIKNDMALAFETFMFCSTSVTTPVGIDLGVKVEWTAPEHIVWKNEHGKQCDMSYDGEKIYCNDEPFDCLPMIDAHRESMGLPPLKSLEFNQFRTALLVGTHDLFVRLQREHFECHTLYTYAMGLINRHIGPHMTAKEEKSTPQPAATIVIPGPDIPRELATPEALKIFERARELGLIDGKYKWLKGLQLLACFAREMSLKLRLGKGCNSDGTPRISWKPFETLFSIPNGKLRANYNDVQKTGQQPAGYTLLDKIFK